MEVKGYLTEVTGEDTFGFMRDFDKGMERHQEPGNEMSFHSFPEHPLLQSHCRLPTPLLLSRGQSRMRLDSHPNTKFQR